MDIMDTNLMVCMDMIAMQNMMAQQQRDMYYCSQYKSTQTLYNGKEDRDYQKFVMSDMNNVQDNHCVNEEGHIQPLRDISPIKITPYDSVENYDTQGNLVAYCRCKEDGDSLIIECCVPEGTLTGEAFERWLLKQVKTANDRYIRKLKFYITKNDVIATSFLKKAQM